MSGSWEIKGTGEFQSALTNLVRRVDVQTDTTVRTLAHQIRSQASANAPKDSGALAASIQVIPYARNAIAVGTALPYARRIHQGFHRADSLGRDYNQTGRPYLKRAQDNVSPGDKIKQGWERALNG